MTDDKLQVKDVFVLNERVFCIIEAWPLRKSYTKFVMYMSYLIVHMVMMYTDLFNVIHNLEQMVENIMDNTIVTTTFVMLFLVRCSKLLAQMITTIKEDFAETRFESVDEMKLYLSYNHISDVFGRYAIRGTSVIAASWYMRPMVLLLTSNSEETNGSAAFSLPFRVHAFLDYHDSFRNYLIMYAYQLPLLVVALCHINTVSLLLNLVLHICGKLSILTHRIKHITTESSVHFNNRLKELVNLHEKLIITANSINSAFQLILMVELTQTSLRMAVLIYMLFSGANTNLVSILTFGMYTSIVTSILYSYSYIGEQLSYESEQVWNAYYDSNWLTLSNSNRKLLLVALCNEKKLRMTAGKTYTFSLFSFIRIIKTSLGYVSLLRTMV